MIDRQKILELRLQMIRARLGSEQQLADFMDALDDNAAELLALAEAALKIRPVHKEFSISSDPVVTSVALIKLAVTARRAMEDLDLLEAEARRANTGWVHEEFPPADLGIHVQSPRSQEIQPGTRRMTTDSFDGSVESPDDKAENPKPYEGPRGPGWTEPKS